MKYLSFFINKLFFRLFGEVVVTTFSSVGDCYDLLWIINTFNLKRKNNFKLLHSSKGKNLRLFFPNVGKTRYPVWFNALLSIFFRYLGYEKCIIIDFFQIVAMLKANPKLSKKDVFCLLFDLELADLTLTSQNNPVLLNRRKRVFLSTHANSCFHFEKIFWIEIAKYLEESGYQVYTNENIGYGEHIILNLKELDFFLRECLLFIGIRNGLCDLLVNTDVKKIIIYPVMEKQILKINNYSFFESDFFTQHNFKWLKSDDITEIVTDDYKVVIRKIDKLLRG
jgi:hypothetical protein